MSKATIEIFTDNGKSLALEASDPTQIEQMSEKLRSPRLFAQPVVIFAAHLSVASLQTKNIELIRFLNPSESFVEPDETQEDIVEISRETFLAEYDQLPDEEKVAARDAHTGDFMTTYLEIHTAGGLELYLRLHVKKKSSQEGRVFFTHLFDRPTMEFRLEEGGFGVLKPGKIGLQVTYPGPGTDVLPGNAFMVD